MRTAACATLCLAATACAQNIYQLDCSAGADELARVNQQTFAAGDSILLKRGTRCSGMLAPHGSGTVDAPIMIGAYGSGATPVIDGGRKEAALKLFNQEHWRIQDIETTGGSPYGILISGDRPLRGFQIQNVAVHDVTGEVTSKESGLVVARPAGPEGVLSDITIDGVTAWNTTQWAGIMVTGAHYTGRQDSAHGADVTVRNSTVHDVYGDGIVLFTVRNGRIEKSVAWNTGLQPKETIGTPNGIWTWMCDDCVVEYNEGYLTSSPGVDAGVYDIDWGCRNNTVQFNYGHDARGYCASVFGADGLVTSNSVVRGNVCLRNGRDAKLAARQGDIFLSTWDRGKLDGVRIADNYIRWSPAVDTPALNNGAEVTGSQPDVFENNTIVSLVPSLTQSSASLRLDGNHYRYEGTGPPKFCYGGAVFSSFDAYRLQTGQDQQGTYGDPDPHPRAPVRQNSLMLLSILDDSEASHSQTVFLRSMYRQYGGARLKVRYAGTPSPDWRMDGIPKTPGAPAAATLPTTLLLDSKGRVLRRWEGFVSAQDMALEIESQLGIVPAFRKPK